MLTEQWLFSCSLCMSIIYCMHSYAISLCSKWCFPSVAIPYSSYTGCCHLQFHSVQFASKTQMKELQARINCFQCSFICCFLFVISKLAAHQGWLIRWMSCPSGWGHIKSVYFYPKSTQPLCAAGWYHSVLLNECCFSAAGACPWFCVSLACNHDALQPHPQTCQTWPFK